MAKMLFRNQRLLSSGQFAIISLFILCFSESINLPFSTATQTLDTLILRTKTTHICGVREKSPLFITHKLSTGRTLVIGLDRQTAISSNLIQLEFLKCCVWIIHDIRDGSYKQRLREEIVFSLGDCLVASYWVDSYREHPVNMAVRRDGQQKKVNQETGS
ncbi:hypothetical protein JTB14_010236 [Gonioctena quinquepunctata]|nr:hypothetical protein JTB14_010236 [Gonioctena quinquepunctata]